jgi:hypothetical protein
MLKVMKSYQMIPSNRKTLFLRNLEKILQNHQVMCECQTKTFRDNTCHEILYLLEDYVNDETNQTNNLMKRKYEIDSMSTRFDDDRRKLFVDHSH